MTTEESRFIGRIIGCILNLVIDVVLAYYIGKHFHAFIVGFTTYVVLAGITSIRYNIDALLKKVQ